MCVKLLNFQEIIKVIVWIMSVVNNFEKLLTDFFSLYHPRQVKKVGKMVQEFKGQEAVVLKLLCDRYKKAYKVVPGLIEALEEASKTPVAPSPIEIDEEVNNQDTSEEYSNEYQGNEEEEDVSEEEEEAVIAEEEEVAEEEEEEK